MLWLKIVIPASRGQAREEVRRLDLLGSQGEVPAKSYPSKNEGAAPGYLAQTGH